ncbi:MAG: argB [Herbinix sp.]|nr:argB [Herbinix sp.]
MKQSLAILTEIQKRTPRVNSPWRANLGSFTTDGDKSRPVNHKSPTGISVSIPWRLFPIKPPTTNPLRKPHNLPFATPPPPERMYTIMEHMDQILMKAQTLIEALPYIQKFNNKKVVVKYGGSAMLDENLQLNVIKDVALLKLVGMQPIIVHGGGKEITKWLSLLGHESKFIEGLRVTDEQTMEVAEMVLGKVNKNLVQMVEKLGVKAVGISGKDGSTLKVEKRTVNGQDIGFVGTIKEVNVDLINTLIDNNFVPVIAPIGVDDDYQNYNINADDVACAVATAIGAEKLAFLTDIEGVYSDPKDKSSLISVLTLDKADELLEGGFIGGGMLPKLKNCVDAVRNGVSRVHILDGRIEHCLLLEFFTNRGIGTAIINKESIFENETANN